MYAIILSKLVVFSAEAETKFRLKRPRPLLRSSSLELFRFTKPLINHHECINMEVGNCDLVITIIDGVVLKVYRAYSM